MNKKGRPTKYKRTYCDDIVAHCREGASLTSFAASIGVGRRSIYEWSVAHKEFGEALDRAKAAAAAWYDEKARGIVCGVRGSVTLCIFGLKNFAPEDFRDVQERWHAGAIALERVVHEFDGD